MQLLQAAFDNLDESADQLMAIYVGAGVDEISARFAASILTRERFGEQRARTPEENRVIKLTNQYMRLAKLTAQKELIEKGMQAMEELRETHKLARSLHPDFGTAARLCSATATAKAVAQID